MRAEKVSMFEEVRERASSSAFVVLTDSSGMAVTDIAELRKQLRACDAEFHVVKNTLFRRVAADLGWGENGAVDAAAAGPSAMVFGTGDVTETTKVLKKYATDNDRATMKFGVLDGSALTAAEVVALATLPSRQVLLGSLVGTLAAPISQLAGVMRQKVATLIYALSAVADSKSEE